MHLGMQRLDPAVHHLGKAGELGDVRHLQPGRGDRLGGAAGGDQFDAMAGERLANSIRPVLSETDNRARVTRRGLSVMGKVLAE